MEILRPQYHLKLWFDIIFKFCNAKLTFHVTPQIGDGNIRHIL